MKKFKVTSTFFAMLAVALIAFGCNENEDDPITPSGDTPAAPTALMATSKSATEVILKWTPSSSASLSTMDNYQLTYTGSSTPITINKSASTYTVTGLTEGTTYTFTLRAKGTNGELSNSATVMWAPARRSDVIRLYSSQSSQGSGLALTGGTGGAPRVLTIANGGQWDIAFDDKTASAPTISSPGQSQYVNDNFEFPNGQLAKQTYVSNERWTGGSTLTLDDIFEASALEAGTAERFHNLAGITQPFAFVARTQEGNYAKILVLANGGQVVQGSGTDKYIEVVVSYQGSPNVPYAGFDPSRNNNTTEGTRRAARVNATK